MRSTRDWLGRVYEDPRISVSACFFFSFSSSKNLGASLNHVAQAAPELDFLVRILTTRCMNQVRLYVGQWRCLWCIYPCRSWDFSPGHPSLYLCVLIMIFFLFDLLSKSVRVCT